MKTMTTLTLYDRAYERTLELWHAESTRLEGYRRAGVPPDPTVQERYDLLNAQLSELSAILIKLRSE